MMLRRDGYSSSFCSNDMSPRVMKMQLTKPSEYSKGTLEARLFAMTIPHSFALRSGSKHYEVFIVFVEMRQ